MHYDISVPGDLADNMEALADLAIGMAKDQAGDPAGSWCAEHVAGEPGDDEVCFRVLCRVDRRKAALARLRDCLVDRRLCAVRAKGKPRQLRFFVADGKDVREVTRDLAVALALRLTRDQSYIVIPGMNDSPVQHVADLYAQAAGLDFQPYADML